MQKYETQKTYDFDMFVAVKTSSYYLKYLWPYLQLLSKVKFEMCLCVFPTKNCVSATQIYGR